MSHFSLRGQKQSWGSPHGRQKGLPAPSPGSREPVSPRGATAPFLPHSVTHGIPGTLLTPPQAHGCIACQWIPEWPSLRVPALPTRTTPSDLAGPTAQPPVPSQGLQPSTWLVPGGHCWVSELEAGEDKAPLQSRVPQPLKNHNPKLSTMTSSLSLLFLPSFPLSFPRY